MMKKNQCYILFLFLLVVGLYSCKKTNSPQAVTEKFLNSFVRMDYEGAKASSTQNTWELLDIWASFAKEIPDDIKKKKAENFKVTITNTKKESDSTVVVTYTTEPKILPFNKIRLLRQADPEGRERWKVDISTLDLLGGEELYIEEENKAVDVEMERQPPDTIKNTQD